LECDVYRYPLRKTGARYYENFKDNYVQSPLLQAWYKYHEERAKQYIEEHPEDPNRPLVLGEKIAPYLSIRDFSEIKNEADFEKVLFKIYNKESPEIKNEMENIVEKMEKDKK